MVRKGIEQFGHIDILVSNAASSHGRDLVPVVDLHEDVWDATLQVESQRSISLLPVRGARNDPAKIRRQNNHHVVRGWKARAGLSGRLCGV